MSARRNNPPDASDAEAPRNGQPAVPTATDRIHKAGEIPQGAQRDGNGANGESAQSGHRNCSNRTSDISASETG